ncbi:MAG TPA: hypothetical protein DEA62_05180 [Coxiellaceae bacterium]|nr:MAG: hypothetical protein A2V89_02175 [Gammaproteobacteria bacterium RBG_16_37_9]HBC71753.1 hypothetical protein [Coxiellaceae bacterium]HBS52349.1 hypothetical protein [Coxiellaceae bacterium]
MRLLDTETNNIVNSIGIYLTKDEAKQMLSFLQSLVDGTAGNHVHVNDDSYAHEITLAIYSNENLDQFDERSRKLISEDS